MLAWCHGDRGQQRVTGAEPAVLPFVNMSPEKVQLRVSTELVRGSDSSQLWSETYDRSLEDVFKVQDEIAAAVVSVTE